MRVCVLMLSLSLPGSEVPPQPQNCEVNKVRRDFREAEKPANSPTRMSAPSRQSNVKHSAMLFACGR
jgi:hypothetical protein